MSSEFEYYPDQPIHTECQNAYTILCNAHDAASSFLQTYNDVRTNRGARGTPTDEEQDLLRAMLLFASAGLDSMSKQLIREVLPKVLEHNEPASDRFQTFIERHLRDGQGISGRTVAKILANKNPRNQLIDSYVRELTSRSLQSVDEIFKAGAAFDLPSRDISPTPNDLREVFKTRNQIAHEMDVDFARSNRSRRSRSLRNMKAMTNTIFRASSAILAGVDSKVDA